MTTSHSNSPIRIAIGGLGAIGKALARRLAEGTVPGVVLSAVSAKNHDKAREFINTLPHPVPVLEMNQLEPMADIVVECAPAAILGDVIGPFLRARKKAIVLSVGAILFRPDLIELARQSGGTILVPTGALIGLDAVVAAAEGQIHSVRMVTRKPPNGLSGAPYLIEHGISMEGLTEPLKVFTGNAKEAAKGFPANLNVVVALALAGIGPDRTMLEIWADPTVVRNTHTITVDSDSAKFTMTMENIPSENPKTGRIVAQSVTALLRKMTSTFVVGT
ncbi:MAG: aspartate dehydrogenase [Betaproteobacteria bacterium]|jgi:aspartate dehydrogenase|nr:aspartate dehydrogenase [Betaproteobacteria bacterium]